MRWGCEFEFCKMGPDQPDNGAFVASAHPAGKFPVLVDGDLVIVEATAIIEYLAVKHPGSSLIPADPALAAATRMIDRVFDHYVMDMATRVVIAFIKDMDSPDQAEIDSAKAALRKSYGWLEHWLGDNALPPHISLASCAAAPSLFYADWIEDIPDSAPRLKALRAELLALPEVSRCVEDARPFRGWFPPGAPDRD